MVHRPEVRQSYPPEERAVLSRVYASGLREIVTLRGPDSRAAHLSSELLAVSAEFRTLWAKREVGVHPPESKRFLHPTVGLLQLNCQTLLDPEQAQRLLVYTAVPGSESYAKLELLAVVGTQVLS